MILYTNYGNRSRVGGAVLKIMTTIYVVVIDHKLRNVTSGTILTLVSDWNIGFSAQFNP